MVCFLGHRIPEDVAVVGFDGVEEGGVVTPPLTSAMQPLRDLVRAAADLLLELMETGSARDRILTCSSVFRQSCGRPPQPPADLRAEVHRGRAHRGAVKG